MEGFSTMASCQGWPLDPLWLWFFLSDTLCCLIHCQLPLLWLTWTSQFYGEIDLGHSHLINFLGKSNDFFFLAVLMGKRFLLSVVPLLTLYTSHSHHLGLSALCRIPMALTHTCRWENQRADIT